MTVRTSVLVAALAVAVWLAPAARAADEAAAAVGKPAPDFALKDTTGKDQALKAYQGKFVVLEWTNLDCPFVKKHYGAGNMPKLQKTYTAKDVCWLTICSSAPGKQGHYPAEKWAELLTARQAAPTAVLLDPDGKLGRLYGAKTTPHLFVIDPQGAVIYAGAIDDRPSPDAATLEGATNYLALALDAALAGKPVAKAATVPYGCSVKYP